MVLEKPDLWDDPVFAGRVSREHGELMGKIKSVNQFEQELIEHIEMLRLAREENDNELETVSTLLHYMLQATQHKYVPFIVQITYFVSSVTSNVSCRKA
jgi:hypothetical protein